MTSAEISGIRTKYGISQSDLCILWDGAARQLPDMKVIRFRIKLHDTILKKIDKDPEWFLSLLQDARPHLSEEAYKRYLTAATALYEKDQDVYLRKAIEAPLQRNFMVIRCFMVIQSCLLIRLLM